MQVGILFINLVSDIDISDEKVLVQILEYLQYNLYYKMSPSVCQVVCVRYVTSLHSTMDRFWR